jgi:hypothetical protein
MKSSWVYVLLSLAILAALHTGCVGTAIPDVAADDEPDQLSWPFFATCQPILRHFFEWAEKNPPPGDRSMEAGKPAESYPYTWIKAATLPSDNAQWRAEKVADTDVFRGPGSHNFRDQANSDITIPADGYYRLWSRYYHREGKNETFNLGVTTFPSSDYSKPDMESKFHIFSEEFSKSYWRRDIDPKPNTASLPTGFIWEGSHRMAFMKAGKYRLHFSGGIYDRPDDPKISDIVFVSDPLYVPSDADIPSNNVSGAKPPCVDLAAQWDLFNIRPGSVPFNSAKPELQAYWMKWRRELIEKLSVSEFTDYVWGNLAAMVYFDEESNLIGRAAEIKAQKRRDAMSDTTFIIRGTEFKNSDPEKKGWGHSDFFEKNYPAPGNICGPAKDSDLTAFYDLDLLKAGRYILWVNYLYIKGWAVVMIEAGGQKVAEFEVGGPGNWKDSGLVRLPSGKVKIVLRRKDDPSGAKPKEYEAPILNRFVFAEKLEFTPHREVEYPAGDTIGDGPTGAWLSADPWAGFTRYTGAESLYCTPYAPYLRKPLDRSAINKESSEITARRGEVVSQLFMLRNNTPEPITFTPELISKKVPATVRLVAYTLPSNGSWSPMLLLKRRSITAPPKQNTAIWLSFDCRSVPEGAYPIEFRAHTHKVRFNVQVKGSIENTPVPYVGVYAKPYPRASSWDAFKDAGITMLFNAIISKAEMKKYGFLHLANVPFDAGKEEGVRKALAGAKEKGLDNSDWSLYLIDEPGPSKYAAWLEMAERIRKVNPTMMIWCNLGGGAPQKDSLPTLLKMMDYWDVSCPAYMQFGVADKDKDYDEYVKRLRGTGRIRMIYDTLDIGDTEKLFYAPLDILKIGELANDNNRNGWVIFSLIYGPPWDDVYTGNQDHAVSLYPGAYGRTISTRNMEAVRESIQRWRKAKLNTAHDN